MYDQKSEKDYASPEKMENRPNMRPPSESFKNFPPQRPFYPTNNFYPQNGHGPSQNRQFNNNNSYNDVRARLGANFDPNNGQWNFVQKRTSDQNCGAPNTKRRWSANNKTPFYNKHYNNNNNTNNRQNNVSVQNRLSNIRGNNAAPADSSAVSEAGDLDETQNDALQQDFDAADITVEVVNASVGSVHDPSRFKMILDPKTQAAIRTIQLKRKSRKQIIYPFPVKPNVTEITMHDRFGML